MAEKTKPYKYLLFWHRRDLRLNDNAGLYHALKVSSCVQPLFIFDTTILEKLPANDQRVLFLYQTINDLKKVYRKAGSDLWVYHGDPKELLPKLVEEHKADGVFANRDYEPYALERDTSIYNSLAKKNVDFKGFKDHVIFDKNEVVKEDGDPYVVYTPYSKKWLEKLNEFYTKAYPTEKYLERLLEKQQEDDITLEKLGFGEKQLVDFPEATWDWRHLQHYDKNRDFPAKNGTSRLGVHLRFGTVSVRQLVREAQEHNFVYLKELIWRDFYQNILYHFPHSAEQSFRKEYDQIEWRNDEKEFKAWCEGKTGYPLVDAGMRELNQTGYMHNRVRMVVASFLTKHLLIDWRWGERYFAEKLLDYDLASNVGGWQWAAGSGVDAAPYFRIFNPASQYQKFDPEGKYVAQFVPEWKTPHYPKPIVEHKIARERALKVYKESLKS